MGLSDEAPGASDPPRERGASLSEEGGYGWNL